MKTVYRTEPPIHISQIQQWFNRKTKHGLLSLPKLSLHAAMLTHNMMRYCDKKSYLSHNFKPAPSDIGMQISTASLLNKQSPKSVCTYTAGTQCQINKENTYIIRKNYMSEMLNHLKFPRLFLFFVSVVGNWKGRRMLYLLLMKNTKKFIKIHLCLRCPFRTLNL